MSALSVAIVVPALNEAETIVGALTRLGRAFPDCAIVVVDGGSTDDTVTLASPYARVLASAPGRARQMNAGAHAVCSDVLWFVHADTAIEPQALGQLQSALADERCVGGGLSLRFDRRSIGLDYLSWSSNVRARRLHWVFGDQAMFVRSSAFDAVGGFPELPILEDLEISRRLHRLGRLAVVPATSTASARRFVEHGTWSMIAFMQYLKALYLLGVDPEQIRRRYAAGPPRLLSRRERTSSAPTRPSAEPEVPGSPAKLTLARRTAR